MKGSSNPLPTPQSFKELYPLSPEAQFSIETARQDIRNILDGKDDRLLCIVGPCSIYDTTATLEYATLFQSLAEELKEELCMVMRVYFEKPRTGMGWKGLLHDPNCSGTHQFIDGLHATRDLLCTLAERNIPIGAEVLDPLISYYLEDTLAWGSIGARTSESQIHRQIVSGLEMPIGCKNSTDGSLKGAVNSIRVAAAPQSYIGLNENGEAVAITSSGNPDAHLVLRGGILQPNYDPESIAHALQLLNSVHLPLRLLIDCSHDNSCKDPFQQETVLKSLLQQRAEGNLALRGFMIESFLHSGQQATPEKYGISLTDSCLDWEATADLLRSCCETTSCLLAP